MQTGSSQKLKLILSVAYASADFERRAHQLLAPWRQHGEWFDLGDRADAFMVTIKQCKAQNLLAFLGNVESLPVTYEYNEWDEAIARFAKDAADVVPEMVQSRSHIERQGRGLGAMKRWLKK